MTLLALDLGTKTGFAMWNPPGATLSGTWNFQPTRHESEGQRYVKLHNKLVEIHKTSPITEVVFEAVERHAGTVAAHVYGGLSGIMKAWCISEKIPYKGYSVGTIKKSWTGKGNADKALMISTARDKGYEVIDDNEADALALLDMVLKARIQ